MPDTDTRLGSKPAASPAAGAASFFPLLKTTPISLARISLPSRISSLVGALITLLSCASRNRLEKTENWMTRSRVCSMDASPLANHSVYELALTMWWSETMARALEAKGESDVLVVETTIPSACEGRRRQSMIVCDWRRLVGRADVPKPR